MTLIDTPPMGMDDEGNSFDYIPAQDIIKVLRGADLSIAGLRSTKIEIERKD